MTNTKAKTENKSIEWATPKELFNRLNDQFRFTLDPCATAENAKCERFYTKDDDGLSRSWAGERVFLNPPYGKELSAWVEKAIHEVSNSCPVVVALFPPRTDAKWFHELVSQADEVRLLQGRVHFENPGNPADRPRDSSCITVFRARHASDPGPPPDFRFWNWKTDTYR